ncbi:MAG: GtrA family protein [Clostridia bacterium]|nr:GtrA family protein [Clostridia bacterium]
MEKIKAFLKKERQLISYLFFGLITTVVSLLAWYLTLKFGVKIWSDENGEPTAFLDILGSTTQWVSGVLVSFITSKLWVFTEADKGWRVALRQFTAFVSSRLLTYFLEVGINLGSIEGLEALNCPSFEVHVFSMAFTIDARLWAKAISSVVIVFSNYFISKFFVFRIKKKEPNKDVK